MSSYTVDISRGKILSLYKRLLRVHFHYIMIEGNFILILIFRNLENFQLIIEENMSKQEQRENSDKI